MTLEQFKEIKLTENEALVVRKYFGFNYEDLASNLEDNANWVDFESVEEINPHQLRGVFSSMIQKNLIFDAEPYGCDAGTFYISDLGAILYFYLEDRAGFDSCNQDLIIQRLLKY